MVSVVKNMLVSCEAGNFGDASWCPGGSGSVVERRALVLVVLVGWRGWWSRWCGAGEARLDEPVGLGGWLGLMGWWGWWGLMGWWGWCG